MIRPAIVILAAGIGSRYGGFKQIDPIGPHGEVVLDYSIYHAWRAGFGKVVFVIQPDLEAAFKEHFNPVLEGKLQTEYVYQRLDDLPANCDSPSERTKPWGTAQAIWTARQAVKEPFAVINADDFYGATSYQLLHDFLDSSAVQDGRTGCMVAFELKNTLSRHGSVSRGICTMQNEKLVNVVERTKIEACENGRARCRNDNGEWQSLSGNEAASMNMWGFPATVFGQIENKFRAFLAQHKHEPKAEFFIPTVVDELIESGDMETVVLHSAEKWFGMTYRDDRPEVEAGIRRRIADGTYPPELWTGQ